ncbi:hypothetical protein BP5796_11466 [Coleophoma crateriformis]|uniref:C6 zinc finger protein n=1 Tax=Coleophoma crateriformis TaxID=565419 RepID=A0A3D8QJG3_9HELO|nr:hypothetical protein BP5796_11466 [Coleophoma crateriformis]
MSSGIQDLDMNHLHLLHHFCVSTFETMHHDPLIRTLWRTTVIHIGYAHAYVMHGILSISALHLAHLHPEQKLSYWAQATQHHHLGLSIATSKMLYVSQENCSALYIFSVLTFMFALASPRKGEDDFVLVGEAGLSEWLVLLRGSAHIANFASEGLLSGPVAPIFVNGRRRNDERISRSENQCAETDQLMELYDLISRRTMGVEAKEACCTAVTALRRAYAAFYTPTSASTPFKRPEPGDVFSWVFQVPKEFLVLLAARSQESLCIMAFFAVIVHPLENIYWWLEGLSGHLMTKAYALLDDEHREWIAWPLEVIGWDTIENLGKTPWQDTMVDNDAFGLGS